METKPAKRDAPKKEIKNFFFYTDEEIGAGSSGKVYKGYEKATNKQVAIKVIPHEEIDKDEDLQKMLKREVEILYQIKGDNVVHLIDTANTVHNFYIIMDFCSGGSLGDLLKKKTTIPATEALTILKQIAEAFIVLDSLSNPTSTKQYAIMHRDLKPANILFHEGKVKIVDFGFAKIVSAVVKEVRMKQTFLGTPLYSSPQILDGEAYSFKCDVWSAGCLIFESIFGSTPWTGRNEVELSARIKTQKLAFPTAVSEDCQDLLKGMLQVPEEKRLDWKGITAHVALTKL
jgi:serine/threonine protein kinase